MIKKEKLIRITTVPHSLGGLLRGQLKFMSGYYEVIGISSYSSDGYLDVVRQQEGIRVIPVQMTRKITPFKDLVAVWKLYRVIKKEKPLIVHTHTPKAGTLGLMAAYFAGVPHRLHTIAGLPLLEAKGRKRLLLDFVEKITYRFATKIFPNSQGLYDIVLKNKYITSDKLTVIGNGSSNGIDTSHFDPASYTPEINYQLRKSLGIAKDDFVYVYVGRLVKDKGINELVSAFSTLCKNTSRIKLVLIGYYEKQLDPLKKNTDELIETNNAILFLGGQEDVRPFLAMANLLIFPSYREGFPNVVLEAGAMELPGIVTNINGCNEIIRHNHNGIIIEPKNEKELLTAMKELYDHPDKLSILAENARPIIVSKYERSYIWNELLKEYRKLEVV